MVPKACLCTNKLCIMALHNILGCALGRLNRTLRTTTYSPHLDIYHRDQRMQRLGWCLYDLKRLSQRIWSTITSVHYIGHLDKRSSLSTPKDHESCTSHRCHALTVRSSGDARHVLGCDLECGQIEVSGEALTRILEQGETPALKIITTGSAASCVVELWRADESPYVAISHVWSHGMGNPDANALPLCQTTRLASFVKGLPSSGLKTTSDDLLVWIDTLCCPSSSFPRGKKLSLGRMQATYHHAAAVLVLAECLLCRDSKNMSELEIMTRLVTSTWITRLWTLQEGALAQILWAQFRDQARNVDAIASDLDTHYELAGDDHFRNDIHTEYSCLRPRYLRYSSLNCRTARDFPAIWHAVGQRSVTWPGDEPLCLACLVKMPSEHLAALPVEDRMPQFWRDVARWTEGIPLAVLFLDRPRLQQRGFRWAPRTFLSTQRDCLQVFGGLGVGSVYGDLRDAGLRVRLPGLLFRSATTVQSLRCPGRLLGGARIASTLCDWRMVFNYAASESGRPGLVFMVAKQVQLAELESGAHLARGTKVQLWYPSHPCSHISGPGDLHTGPLFTSGEGQQGWYRRHSRVRAGLPGCALTAA